MSKYLAMVMLLLAAAKLNAGISVIPVPAKLAPQAGEFRLDAKTRIVADELARPAAELLAARLRAATGYKLNIKSDTAKAGDDDIRLVTDGAGNPESYTLSVTTQGVMIHAPAAAGVFYGTETLLQLLPPTVFSAKPVAGTVWSVPGVEIADAPRYPWRGFMLDVSRHFFTKGEVEQVLDLMALYKLNTFHWHLVDDQGWRIEIKKYPKLTSVGAWRDAIGFGLNPKDATAYDRSGRYGGFYTQREIREVVAYAAARHITVVPEIEMPGHSSAALTAYPQFGCPGIDFAVPAKGGVFTGIYCAGNDATFGFINDVLSEVAPLFPGKYIHIGGDEVVKSNWQHCAKCQWRIQTEGLKDEKELQSYFIRRVEKLVTAHGKSLIGWSEIREGGLAPTAALMDWIGGGVEAARSGHEVVMAPTKYSYFDHYQSTNHLQEPLAIGGFLPLKRVYEFEPMPVKLAPEFQSHILGGQANLWTEYIPSLARVEYMMFPRLCALAEVNWSPASARDWEGFKERTGVNEQRLAAMGVNYRPLAKPE